MTTYTLYQTDEDGGKHYKVDGSTKKIVTEDDEGFKELEMREIPQTRQFIN